MQHLRLFCGSTYCQSTANLSGYAVQVGQGRQNRIINDYCRQGILAGTVLAFARALGEYGATSMIAGYTPGRTATISTTVYQLWRTNDDAAALRWVLINIAISAVVLLLINLLEKRNTESVRHSRNPG